MSVHYKFKSEKEYGTVTFDGMHISVKDLKKAIIHQKRIGKNTDFDLQVTNAQTKEVYNDENALIPKNTSLVIARVPMDAQAKAKPWEGYGAQAGAPAGGAVRPDDSVLSKADLTQMDASEDDKIRVMMTQSTLDYDPSNYMKIRGSNQVGVVPTHYRCFKCHQPGHWIKDCPLGHGQEPMEIKKSTGIPRSFMVPVEGPMVPGAMMTPTGQYAVPVLDHQAYNESPKAVVQTQEEKPEIPEDLLCTICKDLLTDAVMIPCCGNSFCDECIRTVLLESEDHECPDCHEKDISPGTLIPNRFLRNSVSNFKNETGYHKRHQYRNAKTTQNNDVQNVEVKPIIQQEPVVHPAESTTETRAASPIKQEPVKPDSQTIDEPERSSDSQKPIISEADSTETTKSSTSVKEEIQEKSRLSPLVEGPPGVESPVIEKPVSQDTPPGVETTPSQPPPRVKQGQAITSVGSAVNHHRVNYHGSQNNSNSRRDDNSSRHYQNSAPSYSEQNTRSVEERPGTPTVDEPGMGPPGYSGSDPVPYSDAGPPGLHPTATTLPPSQHMHPPPQIQGPPPNQQMQQPPGPYSIPPASTHQPPPGHYPPTSAPPPTGFRMPPPGHPDYNRVGAGTGYGDAHQLPRVLLVTSLDPSVPPPNVAPPQGSFPPRPIFDPTRPPVPFDPHRPPIHGAPPPGYPAYPPGPRPAGRPYPPPRHMQPPPPGMNHRPPPHQPPNVIDDPLEAFNRMLREKDERDRRARQRRVTRSRSYSRSRSSSRSFSRSPRSRSRSPPPRGRHRSRTRSPPPRRRTPRSRSRSFSISRSRSFSRSPSFRGSPGRDYSPRRRPPSRYRSPVNRGTPPRYRYKDSRPLISDRERDRILDRHDRHGSHAPHAPHDRHGAHDRPREPLDQRDSRDYFEPPPTDHFEYEGYERGRARPPLLRNPRYGGPPRKDYPQQDGYYNQEMQYGNRYNSRGPNYPPPLMSVKTIPPHAGVDRPEQPHRKYDELAPPGIEQPPVPGFETQRYDNRYPFERPRDDGPPGVDRFQKSPHSEREEHRDRTESNREFRDRPRDQFDRKYSPSPDRRHKSPSPKRSSRDRASSIDKSRRRRRDESSDRDKRNDSKNESDREKKDKKRDTSEDEKSRKSKDKKKKKEKREAERKKKKEKKEKKEQEKLKKAEEKKAKENNETKEKEQEKEKKDEPIPETVNKEEPKIEEPPVEEKSPPPQVEEAPKEVDKPKVELYDDILSEGIDNSVVANYGKIDKEKSLTPEPKEETKIEEPEEKDTSFDGIELQANEAELKSSEFLLETKPKSEVLAPLPEPSKWEIDEDTPNTPEKPPPDNKNELKQVFERPGKVVTSEVIKRAENAIFAKAINAIRPIEIKKISLDRAKLYSGEKNSPQDPIKEPVKNFQITIPGWNLEDIPPPGTEPLKIKAKSPPPSRLSVKERLGCKVEELDRITKKEEPFERNRSRTLSPLSRRIEEGGRNVSLGERRVEIDDRRREDIRFKNERRFEPRNEERPPRTEERRPHRNERSRSRDNKYRDRRQPERKDYRDRREDTRRDDKRDDKRDERRSRSRHRERRHDYRDERYNREEKHEPKERERKSSKTRRSKSRSESRDRKDKRKKSKDKKHKKEKEKEKDKGRKHKKEDENEQELSVVSKISEKKHDDKLEKAKPLEDRRKPTLDEANFEPDYDLETESEKEDIAKKLEIKKRERSKSPEKKPVPEPKKRKMEEEKKHKESSSSDSSDSSSDEKHKKKHKKHKKKKSRRDTSSSSDSSDSDSSVDKKKKRHKSSKKLKKKKKSKHK